MNDSFKADYYRMTGKKWKLCSYADLLLHYELRYLKHIRTTSNSIFYKMAALNASRKYGLEILSKDIGMGLFIGHPHSINVHPHAKIGKNCNLNKGVTVGIENRGSRIGAPTLGDEVWVGTNAVVVGRVTIGNDVMIAPNAFVNFDVPDHSVVIGNPAIVKKRDNAVEGYITNKF